MKVRHYTVSDIPDGSDALFGAFVARDYHAGMMTALYAMSSTGSLELTPGEGLGRITREVMQAIADATRYHPADIEPLQALLEWIVTEREKA